jgi:RNA polymerase sigma-70 factor (ECF subfamily)
MAVMGGADATELIHRARGGEGVALGRLLERYRNYLVVIAQVQIGRRLQGKFDAHDVVQEAFLRAHAKFGQFHGGTEPELAVWLRQILASRLANLIRHYYGTSGRDVRLERELVRELEESSRLLDRALVAPGSSPSERAGRREQAVVLADALDELPDHYRQVIVLHQVEDLSFPEVARRMGRTVDSVKNLWLRALAKLREILGDRL